MSQHTTITTTSVASGFNYSVYINHEQHSDGPAESTAERIIGGWAPSEQAAKQAAEQAVEAQA
jgi:deoxyhypusine synthase